MGHRELAGWRGGVVCLDVDGTLTDGILGPVLPGAGEAVRRVREKCPVRLLTNATSVPHRQLAARLIDQGLLDEAAALYTPVSTARRVLPERGHAHGLLIADPAVAADFAWFRADEEGGVVLLATEGHDLPIQSLQPAFRRLLGRAPFYTLQRNRFFRDGDQLVTDLGPVVAFLEYAAGTRAETLGKPAPVLFDAVAADCGVCRSDLIMVGDDAEFDASASVALGMRGVLVRTGKYRSGDEARFNPPPTRVLDGVRELPALLGGI